MDTSLSDIIEARQLLLPYDVGCVGSSVSQYYYLQKMLTNKYIKKLGIFN